MKLSVKLIGQQQPRNL